MILKIKTAPAIEPVELDEIRNHLRIDNATEDALLSSLARAARELIESLCGPIITQTWYQYDTCWPSGEALPIGKPRLQSVVAVRYTDDAGVQSTLPSSSYTVAFESEHSPAIIIKDGYDWPADDLSNANPIEIEFVCGYGETTDAVPEALRLAILLLTSHWYENREPVNIGNIVNELPFGVEALISNYRAWGY